MEKWVIDDWSAPIFSSLPRANCCVFRVTAEEGAGMEFVDDFKIYLTFCFVLFRFSPHPPLPILFSRQDLNLERGLLFHFLNFKKYITIAISSCSVPHCISRKGTKSLEEKFVAFWSKSWRSRVHNSWARRNMRRNNSMRWKDDHYNEGRTHRKQWLERKWHREECEGQMVLWLLVDCTYLLLAAWCL